MRKNNSDPSLLYSYDSDTGHISPLPASPLLLPVMLTMLIVEVIKAIARWFEWQQWQTTENIFETRNVTREEYERDRKQYLSIVRKRDTVGLDDIDRINLRRVMYPHWLKPGEPPVIYK